MWTNSNELLEHALRELQNNKQEIEIVLDSNSIKGDILAIRRIRKKLRINKIIKIVNNDIFSFILIYTTSFIAQNLPFCY